jgi:hypothetical protein
MERRDKIGRKIGQNWWRELIVDSWFCAHRAWWLLQESEAMGYETEKREFAERNPQPTLKRFMIDLADPSRRLNEDI